MRMTKQEFDRAFEVVQQQLDPYDDRELDFVARIVGASISILRHRARVTDDAEWSCSAEEVVTFLGDLDSDQRRKLKQIAEGLEIKIDPLFS